MTRSSLEGMSPSTYAPSIRSCQNARTDRTAASISRDLRDDQRYINFDLNRPIRDMSRIFIEGMDRPGTMASEKGKETEVRSEFSRGIGNLNRTSFERMEEDKGSVVTNGMIKRWLKKVVGS